MEDFSGVYNIFEDDTLIPVVVPVPENIEQAYIRLAAIKFGELLPKDYYSGVKFLYGQKSHGSSSKWDHEADREVRENGMKLMIPMWITNLHRMVGTVMRTEVAKAYKDGKEHGKSVLRRLGEGDMTVTNFEKS